MNSVLKSGTQHQIHAQKCILGLPKQVLACKSKSKNCKHLMLVTGMSGQSSFECCVISSQYNMLHHLLQMYHWGNIGLVSRVDGGKGGKNIANMYLILRFAAKMDES